MEVGKRYDKFDEEVLRLMVKHARSIEGRMMFNLPTLEFSNLLEGEYKGMCSYRINCSQKRLIKLGIIIKIRNETLLGKNHPTTYEILHTDFSCVTDVKLRQSRLDCVANE